LKYTANNRDLEAAFLRIAWKHTLRGRVLRACERGCTVQPPR